MNVHEIGVLLNLLSKKGVKEGYASPLPSFPFPATLVAAFSV